MIVPYGFSIFLTICVFEVKESIGGIPIKLCCSCDLDNAGHLPVQEVLGGTDDCVLWFMSVIAQSLSKLSVIVVI